MPSQVHAILRRQGQATAESGPRGICRVRVLLCHGPQAARDQLLGFDGVEIAEGRDVWCCRSGSCTGATQTTLMLVVVRSYAQMECTGQCCSRGRAEGMMMGFHVLKPSFARRAKAVIRYYDMGLRSRP